MTPTPALCAFIQNLGPMEMLVVMGIAVLLFGKRLPEVGRSLGKGIVEFKKGLSGITEELDLTATSTTPAHRYDDIARSSSPNSGSSSHYTETSVPKFEPPAPAPEPQPQPQD
jgi:sec-independent protein translocase protein TatA